MNTLESLAAALGQLIRDRVAVLVLRQQIVGVKAQRYDQLAENAIGLRRALETQQRQAEELQRQLEESDEEIRRVRTEYASLETRQSLAGSVSVRDERLTIFHSLQTMLTQLPTMRAAIEEGADIRAQDVLEMLRPLDQLLVDLGFDRIGEAGKEVAFDPTRHKPVGREAQSVAPEDQVRVRYVGYTFDGEIACKAEVTLVERKETVRE